MRWPPTPNSYVTPTFKSGLQRSATSICLSLPWHLQKAILRQQNLGSSDQAPAGGRRYADLCFSLAKGTRWQRHEQRAFPRELIVLQAQMPQWLRHRSLTKLEPRNNRHLPLMRTLQGIEPLASCLPKVAVIEEERKQKREMGCNITCFH